ncbi:MAG: glycoside hydrolase family 44 protein [Bryobacteraceae bacterium]
MRPLLAISLVCLASFAAAAQPAPVLSVDATVSRHPISPYIYGFNEWPSYNSSTHTWTDKGMSEAMRVGARRWGGDTATSYNWQLDIQNLDDDWYFTTYVVGDGVNSTFDVFHEGNLKTGTLSLGTVPVLDWTPKLIPSQPLVFNAPLSCSFAVAKYGKQVPSNAANCAADPTGSSCAVDPYDTACGSGFFAAGKPIVNDPNDVYQPITPAFAGQWVQSIKSKYGPANLGGVQMWSLDNEPEWWDGVHMDIYQQNATYDDMLRRDEATAQAVKAADPTALITGPVAAGWSGMLFSKKDMQSGWNKWPYCYYDNPVDQNAHGGLPWLVYYLQQMRQFEQTNGYRLLDYLDVHGYITPTGIGFDNTLTAANTLLRMTSTRAFWDPNYIVPVTGCNGYYDAAGNQVGPALVPTMHGWVNQNYPNTKLAITEYNWGALEDITGAVAQADILGIFGREQLDMATMWPDGNFTLGVPGSYAFQIFLNYDGNGSQFGETSVSAITENPDVLSIFAAQRHDSALTVLVLNKTASAVTDTIPLTHFAPAATAQVWRYSGANLNAIVRQTPDLSVAGNGVSTTFPAYSMTLFVIPQAQSAMSVPQPSIGAITNAASYDATGVSPGEIVAIWGQGLGPAAGANFQFDSNDLIATSLGGTQVFFNGYPAPLIYASSGQVNAVVPYEAALAQTASVIVVYQGNPSAPSQIAISAAKPGIFTNNNSGGGQGAILNQDFSLNGPSNPAPRGQYVLIYATGEGVTTPPGMNGRLSEVSGSPLPTVAAACSATIGGVTTTLNYCGEAPGFTAGLVQVNALVPASIAPGNAVPVTIAVGGVTSQANVTLAVQ